MTIHDSRFTFLPTVLVSRALFIFVLLLSACGVPTRTALPELVEKAKAGDSGAVVELVGRMGSEAPRDERSAAYGALLELDVSAPDVVRKACGSGDSVLREHALALAGNRKWPWAYEAAVAALKDSSFSRRYVGAWVLGELGRVEAVPVLARALDGGGEASRAATRALIKLGKPAVPKLLELAPGLGPGGRGAVVRVLGDVGDLRGEGFVIRALADPETRADAALAQGKVGGAEGAVRLMPLLEDGDWEVRMQAARSLGVLEYRAADGALDRLRNDDPVPAVREWAARSLAIVRGSSQTFVNGRGEEVLPGNLFR